MHHYKFGQDVLSKDIIFLNVPFHIFVEESYIRVYLYVHILEYSDHMFGLGDNFSKFINSIHSFSSLYNYTLIQAKSKTLYNIYKLVSKYIMQKI